MPLASMDALVAAIIPSPTLFGKDAGTAEAVGIMHTPWYGAGITGAGAAPTGGLNGALISATAAGRIPIPATVSGETSYLARLSMQHTGNIGSALLIDRQWGNVPVVTTTGAQAITSPTWPARDASASTSGVGVYLALEASVVTGNAGAITNTTVSYTNSDGTAGRTATLASWPITGVAGTFVPFSLQAGDVGVRSVQSITLGTSYISGAIHLVAFRIVTDIGMPTANVLAERPFTSLGLPAVWDSSVLQLVYMPTSTAPGAVVGTLTFAQG